MRFEMDADFEGDLGAPVDEVAQAAIDAAATSYTQDADVDVEQQLRAELASRGIRAASPDWVAEAAHEIRSGHHLSIGRPDGFTEGVDRLT